MAIEDLRVIGDVVYERRADGMLYPVRRVAPAGLLASQPEDQGSATGFPEFDRILVGLGNANQMFNPVEGIGQSMAASRRMAAPDTAGWDRVAAFGDMLSGVAGVTAPVAAAARAGTPAAVALMEGLLGGSPTMTAAKDTARTIARTVAERANQRGPVPTMGSNLGNLLGDVGEASTGIRAYQGSPHNFAAERLVRMPDGSTQYIVGKPDVLPNVPAGAEVLQDFPLGRMRMDKLGTGEGAQAYGPGLYTAQNEDVATGYKQSIQRNSDELRRIAEREGGLSKDASELLSFQFSKNNFNGEGFDKWLDGLKENLSKGWLSDRIKGAVEEVIAKEVDASEAVRKMKSPGLMYQVDINADPATLLDWDQPLGQQSEMVRAAFASLGPPERLASVKGENAYRALEDQSGSMDWPVGANSDERTAFRKAASEKARQKMLDAGIPGIKYLDEGSRAAGAGTRNYVVFDENLISIVRKYGIAGAAAMLGVSAVDVEEAMARGQPPQGLLSMGSK